MDGLHSLLPPAGCSVGGLLLYSLAVPDPLPQKARGSGTTRLLLLSSSLKHVLLPRLNVASLLLLGTAACSNACVQLVGNSGITMASKPSHAS